MADIELKNAEAQGQAKKRERPAMQIYRPPGLRGGEKNEKNAQELPASPTSVKYSTLGKTEQDRVSNASSESRSSSTKNEKPKPKNKPSVTTPTEKKKQFTSKDFDDIVTGLRKLEAIKDQKIVEDFINSNLELPEITESLALCLTRQAIEESNKQVQRAIARLIALILSCPTGSSFHKGLLASLNQYYECRGQLRETHLKVWINFLSFLSDVYANIGFEYEGGLVDLLFKVLDYMLEESILETLKIEELESVIGCLLSVGYDLERNCPDQLGSLKDRIRDAFVAAHEPWARKMIMLLMELSASGWSLPSEANEYYFQ
ncbi:unnamed protein product [Bursaphelenchus xylophilus]|uniref:(pine wood nematode) hypothetical protein n=1 Tax=Bursaphelenchus xylophilus TaxID=6326 RepID=A0A1I7RRT3_BURXY|nr:unnamed protein product [Bursaphelenchus xylophilus]CAG9123491.1 unnamed protein product [Bursaphelenchus xylophilus]